MSFYPKDAVPVDGLLSLNMFEGRVVTIDFPANKLTIETDETLKKRVRGAVEVPARLTREVQGRALAVSVAVPTKQGSVWMELDTGNSRTILISKPYAELFGLATDKGREPQSVDFPLAGDIRVKSDRAFAPDMIIDGNIGMPFLKNIVLTIDLRNSRVWMKK